MSASSLHIRAYVIGTTEEQAVAKPMLMGASGEGLVCCFGTVQQGYTELVSELSEQSGYDCILFLISTSSGIPTKVLRDFQRVTRQGIPTYAVFLVEDIGHEFGGDPLDGSSVAIGRAELERIALRLGAAGVFLLNDLSTLSQSLSYSLESHSTTEAMLCDLEEPESYIHELKRSELEYRNLVQLSRDLIWSVDSEGRWTFMSDACYEILGYYPKEMIGRRFTEFQDPKDASRDLVTFSKVLEGTKHFDYETHYIAKDGSQITLLFNALVSYDEEGLPIGATGTAVDITAKRRSAEDLKNQKEFFRQVVDSNPNPIGVRNLNGQFVLVNRAFAKNLRYDPDDLIGLTYDEVLQDKRALKLVDIHDEQLRESPDEEIRFEQRAPVRKGDSLRWLQTTRKIIRLPHSDEPYLLEVSVDLTERKRSEEALRHVIEGTAGATAEDYFPSLLEHLTAALQLPAGVIYRLNENGESFQVIAQYPDQVIQDQLTIPVDNQLFEELVREHYICLPEDAESLLPSTVPPDYQAMLATILRNSRSEPIGMLIVMGESLIGNKDLSEYLLTLFGERASAELTRLTSELETKRLERQLLQAQKMEAIGTLAAGVAHDLNNALSAVAGHLQLLESSPKIDEDQKQSLHIALDGCGRASRLVHQLLGFSRQGKYVPERIALHETLVEMIEFLNCATRKDIAIEIQNISDNLLVHADRNQFQQVMMNLIINAQQAMASGGVITISAESEFIRLPEQYNQNATQGEYSIIRVSDTGPGIDTAIRDKIFEPFFTTKPAQVGTGLGLAMVYGIMQNHGGWVEVQSTPGEGSTFELYFPRTVVVQDAQGEYPPATRIEKPLVLVVDDEPFLVDLTCRFLERSGFRSRGFTDPREALSYFEKNQDEVDLTILDMKMPQLDGKSCFQKIRSLKPEAQVVILSGYIQDDSAREVMEDGALRYFQKPLRYSELIDWVRARFQEQGSTASAQ